MKMKILGGLVVLIAAVIATQQHTKQPDFVTTCCKGHIDLGAELYERLSAHVPTFTHNIVSECDNIFTNIIRKQPNVLDESKMLRLRYILNTYLKECIRVQLDVGSCLPSQMYTIDKEYKCTYSAHKDLKFGGYLNLKEYKNIMNYNNLSQPKGLLSNLLNSVINLIVNLLHAEDNLLNGLLGQVLGLKGCIQSVIGVVDTIVRGVYVSLEKLLIGELGEEYFGVVTCTKVNPSFMASPCVKMNRCLDAMVGKFYNETVHHVYRCMHMKHLQLQQYSLHKIMNMY